MGPRSIASSGWTCFFSFSEGWCCLVSCFFGWCCCFPFSFAWCCLSSFGWGLRSPSLLLGGAAWFSFSGWCCRFSVLLVGLLFTYLLLGGAAWSTPCWGGVEFCFACFVSSSSFGRCCFSNLLSCGPAFLLLLLVGLPSITSSGWSCFFHLLKGGAAWFPSSLGGVAFPLSGAAFRPLLRVGPRSPPPLLGGAAFLSLLWVVVLSHLSSVGWCCLVSSFTGRRCFFSISFCVLLPSFSSSGWDYRSPVFCWVVLLGPLLLGVVLRPALSPPPPLGGVAFLLSFGVVLPSFSFGWARVFNLPCWVVLLSFPSFGVGLRSTSLRLGGAAWFPPLGGVAFLSLPVGSGAFLTSSVGWCCLVPSPLGWCCIATLFFAWCSLPFPPLGWDCVPPLFSWVLLCLLLLWAVLLFQSPFSGPAFSSFWWGGLPSPPLGGAAFFHLLKGGAASFPSSLTAVPFLLSLVVLLPSFPSFGWGCFPFPPLGWGFLPSRLLGRPLGGVAVFFFSFWWYCLPPPPVGGAAFRLSSVGWCCLVSSSFGPCCFSNLLLCAAAFVLLLSWSTRVVLRCFFVVLPFVPWVRVLFSPLVSLLRVVLPFFFCPSGGTTFHCCLVFLLLGVVLRCSSFFCEVLPSFPSFGVELRSPSLQLGPALPPWAVLLFQSPQVLPSFTSFGWGHVPSSPLGGAVFSSSVGWRCLVSPLWVVLPFFLSFWWDFLFPCLLLGGAAWSTPLLGGVAFPISFQVVLPSFPLLLVGLPSTTFPGWSSFFPSEGWCCFVSFFFNWCSFSPLLCRAAAFLPLLWVVVLCVVE